MARTALFLGGGAPNLTLMSGALLALHEARIRFDTIAMAGAGAVVGLIYLAPNGGLSKKRALENTINFGISDAIYQMLPINYKVFAKSGPSADAFNKFWFSLPAVRRAMRQHDMTDREKLWADWLLFLGAVICPTDLNFFSKGFCEHPRFIEDLIDFQKLQHVRENIEINAFDIEKHQIIDFKNRDNRNRPKRIRVEELRAALSFPFIYPPYQLDGRHYYEGAAFQTLNRPEDIANIDRFIVLNPLRSNLVRAPDNLWDAYTQSIIMPVVGLAEEETGPEVSWIYYRGALNQLVNTIQTVDRKTQFALVQKLLGARWYSAKLRVEADKVHDSVGWKRSSLKWLFNFGYERGRELAEKIRDEHPDFDLSDLAQLINQHRIKIPKKARRGKAPK